MRLKLVKEHTEIDFMAMRMPAFFLTGLLMAAAIVLLFTKGLNLGIDFTGGLMVEASKPSGKEIADIRKELSTLSEGTPLIQEFGQDAVMIKLPGAEADGAAQKALVTEIQQKLGAGSEMRRVEYVGPQVGGELIKAGVTAFVLSMMGIMAYIWVRFEWQFGVTGIFALVHDVCATILFFILTGIEFDLSTVAAVLLVAGYSINDTVIIFDRIREMMRKHRKMPLPALFNLAINQTLSRTMMTSLTTLLALTALAIFGAENIRGFTLALIVGILVGTFSSIFVASAQLLYLNLRPDALAEDKPAKA